MNEPNWQQRELNEIHDYVAKMRRMGCAVVVLTYDELQGADSSQIEEIMLDRGMAAIETLADDEEDKS
jgi:hypothetical protein